jgi:alginate O-acetyltransferase complex protein AlgJ
MNWPQKIWDTLTIVVFLTLLWLPTMDHFFKIDHAPIPVENRRPAPWPQFQGIGQSREFVVGIESYFNDRFGFRKQLIRINNHLKGRWFHDASVGRPVLIGRDGWLYYSGDAMLENWTRESSFNDQDLGNWCRLLEMRRDWLRERGIKYIFVVPPDKHTVYPEFLPDWMEMSTKPSKIQQLVQYMKLHSTVEVLDLSQVLIDAKKVRVNYLKTDTHWNLFGSFMGYQALLQALNRQMPELKPLPLDTYDWKVETKSPGDLATLLGRTDFYTEPAAVEPVPLVPLPDIKLLYHPEGVPPDDTPEHSPCYTLNEKATGKALVFRDSFAINWYPFLGQDFNEVLYIWHYDWDRPLIEMEKPDVVIDEIAERFFNIENPVELARKDQSSETKGDPALW